LSTEDGVAIAVIGGLIVSTALTLYVVPLIM
jgi:multidrug efflux pump subunit AcrB